MSKSKLGSFIRGFALAAVGTALGLLLAPARGEETRRRLASRGRQLMGRGKEVTQRAAVRVKEATARGGARLTPTVEKIKAKLRPQRAPAESPSGEEVASAEKGEST